MIMSDTKVTYTEFIKQVSKKSGYAQKDIREVFDNASEIIHENLQNDKATTAMMGLIIYPANFRGELVYPRARFGRYFRKDLNPVL